MKETSKRVICAVLALMLTFSLVACGGQQNAPAGTTAPVANGGNDSTTASADIPVVKIALATISELTRLESVTNAINEILVEETG